MVLEVRVQKLAIVKLFEEYFTVKERGLQESRRGVWQQPVEQVESDRFRLIIPSILYFIEKSNETDSRFCFFVIVRYPDAI